MGGNAKMAILNNLDDVPRLKFAHLPTKIEPMDALKKCMGDQSPGL